jgi:hypothetical protein
MNMGIIAASRLRGGAFTPLSLFTNGEQGAWYDPSDISTLFQESGGNTPVTDDGDFVRVMQDKSGNGNQAFQSLSSMRPVYPGLAYDGVDDYLRNNFDMGSSDFIISIVVGTQGLSGNTPCAFGLSLNSPNGMFFYANTSFGSANNQIRVFAFNSQLLLGPDIRDTGDRILTLTRENDTFSLYVDGEFYSSGVQSGSFGETMDIGSATSNNDRQYNGDKLGGMVIIKTSNFSSRTKIENYLASEAGITL